MMGDKILTRRRVATWTPAEDAELARVYPKGGLIACRRNLPHRPADAIQARVKRLGLHLHATHHKPGPKTRDAAEFKTRACLACREDFPSEWAGERVCPACKGLKFWGESVVTTFSNRWRAP